MCARTAKLTVRQIDRNSIPMLHKRTSSTLCHKTLAIHLVHEDWPCTMWRGLCFSKLAKLSPLLALLKHMLPH